MEVAARANTSRCLQQKHLPPTSSGDSWNWKKWISQDGTKNKKKRILKNVPLQDLAADSLLSHSDCTSEIYTNMSFEGILNFKHVSLPLQFIYIFR